MYAENEIFFPHHLIASLRTQRGPAWQQLVNEVMQCQPCDDTSLAFMLMMIRLNGCVGCETDSFRAMRGCLPCALQTLRRYKGSDDELLALYDQALHDVRQFARAHPSFQLNLVSVERVPVLT
jgi:hypothetical protein